MVVVFPLLLLLLSCSSPAVLGADEEHGYTVVALSSLKAHAACSGHRVIPPHNGSWVPLHRPLGPCSPLFSGAGGPEPPPSSSMAELHHQDVLRVDDIHRRLSGDVGDDKQGSNKTPMNTQVTQLNGQSTLQANVGSGGSTTTTLMSSDDQPTATGGLPGVTQTLVLDTASDIPWVQCSPCPVPPCHPQTGIIYNPSMSSTYTAIPCNSPACLQLGPYANGCINNQCQYRVVYPDGSSSSGTYSSDLLTFDPSNSISNFQFGCSRAVQGGSFDPRTAGIMALGGGPESLVSQAAGVYGDVFSYCIPPTASVKGFFVLGVPRVAATRYVLTPLLRSPNVPKTFYRVLLKDISVAGRRLNIPATVFAAGAVLDTRTVLTRLPPTAYVALRDAFRGAMGMYRMVPPKGPLDTCYDFTGVGVVRLPKITLVFDGRNAVVELDPSAVLFNDCLAFIPNSNDAMPGILGNVQQQTIEVLYNVGGGLVGFRHGSC
nr:unnamed protein product [Digitaria exilis]